MIRLAALLTTVGLLAGVSLAQMPSQSAPVPQSSTIRLLNERIPEVSFDSVPFEQVMDWVAEITGANVVVRWQALEDMGIERDKPITIKLKNLRLSQVLWMIMNEAGGADVKLAYRASGSLLILSTQEDLSKEMIVRVYDVSDLLMNVPRFDNAATLDPAQALQQQGQAGGGGGAGAQLFQSTQQNQQREDEGAEGADIQRLIELIQQTVEPDSWVEPGGGSGTIFAFRNLLIVYNTPLVHQQLGGSVAEMDGP